jgi:hypothetical protein
MALPAAPLQSTHTREGYEGSNQFKSELRTLRDSTHCYPDSHPQAKSNPQESWCYPLAALGAYRAWLQDVYIEGGKFSAYLKGKVSKGEIASSVAQLAVTALVPTRISPPRS